MNSVHHGSGDGSSGGVESGGTILAHLHVAFWGLGTLLNNGGDASLASFSCFAAAFIDTAVGGAHASNGHILSGDDGESSSNEEFHLILFY